MPRTLPFLSQESPITHSLSEREAVSSQGSGRGAVRAFFTRATQDQFISRSEKRRGEFIILVSTFPTMDISKCPHLTLSSSSFSSSANINWSTVSSICGPCVWPLCSWLLPLPKATPIAWVHFSVVYLWLMRLWLLQRKHFIRFWRISWKLWVLASGQRWSLQPQGFLTAPAYLRNPLWSSFLGGRRPVKSRQNKHPLPLSSDTESVRAFSSYFCPLPGTVISCWPSQIKTSTPASSWASQPQLGLELTVPRAGWISVQGSHADSIKAFFHASPLCEQLC